MHTPAAPSRTPVPAPALLEREDTLLSVEPGLEVIPRPLLGARAQGRHRARRAPQGPELRAAARGPPTWVCGLTNSYVLGPRAMPLRTHRHGPMPTGIHSL